MHCNFFVNLYLALSFVDICYVYFNPFQDDDEADTVGCCTLKVENVTCLPPNRLQVLIFILFFEVFFCKGDYLRSLFLMVTRYEKLISMLSDVQFLVQFDFLGKDSIRYLNTVEAELPVYQAIKEFCAGNSHALSYPSISVCPR
jgi:DNA topoisomerase-1